VEFEKFRTLYPPKEVGPTSSMLDLSTQVGLEATTALELLFINKQNSCLCLNYFANHFVAY
jgi:hypothetical protein